MTAPVARIGVGLLAAWLGVAGLGRAGDEPRTLADIRKEHEAADEAIRARWDKAETDAERASISAEIWKGTKAAARRAFDWADAHKDDPEAVDAIIWTVHGLANGYYPEYAEEIARAFTLLTERAIGDEKVAVVCYYADGVARACPEAERFLDTALATSPSRLIRAAACLGLARDYRTRARLARRLDDPIMGTPLREHWSKYPGELEKTARPDPDADARRAEAYFGRVIDEFGDLTMPPPRDKISFTELARRELFAMRHLAIGKPSPDLEGEDVRGGKVRLADYRGKVVAIVFWATWCGPCMGMVPHERELVQRMEGKPFVLLGVNGDDDRAAAAKVMDEQGMTWPSVWNGDDLGNIVAAWGVRAWPTIYVLDAQGIIRYDALRGEDLERAVAKLVAEAEAAR